MVAPAWQRWLSGALLLALGTAGLVWGALGLVTWVTALRQRADVIRTSNLTFGVAVMGIGLIAAGLLSPLSWRTVNAHPRLFNTLGRAALVVMIAGIVAVPLGALATEAVMRHDQYRICKEHLRGRIWFITWAAPAHPCPATHTVSSP